MRVVATSASDVAIGWRVRLEIAALRFAGLAMTTWCGSPFSPGAGRPPGGVQLAMTIPGVATGLRYMRTAVAKV
jgi:hypothetical protein